MNWPAERCDESGDAPGAPGIAPTWASSAKDLVGTTLGAARLWFTTAVGDDETEVANLRQVDAREVDLVSSSPTAPVSGWK